MNVEIMFGGFLTQLYSNCGRLGQGIVNTDIDGIDTMLNKSREGYGLTSDCTDGLRKYVDRIVKRYLTSKTSPANKTGLSQILYIINKRLPEIRRYYGENSYSEAARALIEHLEGVKIKIMGVL